MAMAAIEMLSAMNRFGLPGIEISVFWGSALMMSQKSSSDPSMIARLMSVTDFVIDLKGSSCCSRS
jgi:translation elongation factor EF-Tu-like GTPase